MGAVRHGFFLLGNMDDQLEALRKALKQSEENVAFLERICEGVVTAIAVARGVRKDKLDRKLQRTYLADALQLLNDYSAYQLRKRFN